MKAKGDNTLRAKDLIELLQALPDAEVYIEDQETGDQIPVTSADVPYGGPITLKVGSA